MKAGGRVVRNSRQAGVLLCTVIAATFAHSPAKAARARRVGLADMSARAERIFVGRCVERNIAPDPVSGLPSSLYTFQVSDRIKGALAPRTSFRMPGTPDEPFAAGFPSFEEGEEALLFLYPVSRTGFTSPIAIRQGHFRIAPGPAGLRQALNGTGNADLLSDVPTALLKDHNLARPARGSLPLGRLTALVRALSSEIGRP